MNSIITISGKVNYQITLDPGVWIFDDRKIDLTTYFIEQKQQHNELETYTKAVSQHWDREICEGATYPPTLKTERKYEKEKILTGSFGIPFEPFLKNAEPLHDATKVRFSTNTNDIILPLEKANNVILGFSHEGKPLTEDGPVHLYYGDGSNVHQPIKSIRKITLE